MNQSHPQQPAASPWSPQLLNEIAHAPNLAAAAGHLAANNIPVFPCVPGGKRPATSHGFHDASTDRNVTTSRWGLWPDANIGVPTGRVGGIDVVDVDVHASGTGFDAFERARRAGLVEGWAWLVRTPSGGLHSYFLHDPEMEQRSWQAPRKHIDFRGDGGYIVVPPSQVAQEDGTTVAYRQIAVATNHVPRPVDAVRLRRFLDPPSPGRRPSDLPVLGAHADKLAAWVASRPEGSRNGGLFWASCRMAEDGLDLSTATNLLAEAACTAGLSESEAMATIRSAYRANVCHQPASPSSRTPAVGAVGL